MEDGFFDFSFAQCYNLGIFLSKEAPIPFTIRPAVATDREQLRPLQKEIAELHHAGWPDLFRTEARYFSPEEFAQRLSEDKYVNLIAQDASGQVIGYAFGWVLSYRNHSTYVDHAIACMWTTSACCMPVSGRAWVRPCWKPAARRRRSAAVPRWN